MQTRRFRVLAAIALAALLSSGAVAQETTETTENPAVAPTPEAAADPAPAAEPESTAPAILTFETTVDFVLVKSIALEGRAGEVEFRGVEFTAAATKGGVFGTSDADLKTTVTVMLDCSTTAEKKAKVDLIIQFLDEDGELIDRVTDSASLKTGAKTVEVKHTTLKYVVPRIKTVKISAVAKG